VPLWSYGLVVGLDTDLQADPIAVAAVGSLCRYQVPYLVPDPVQIVFPVEKK
jgi:hypothetical protein